MEGLRFLFVASLHHPDPGRQSFGDIGRDFPVTQSQHFWVKALRKMGHKCFVFWRSASAFTGRQAPHLQMHEHTRPGAVLRWVSRAFPEINPDVRLRNRRMFTLAHRIKPDVIVMIGGNHVILPKTVYDLKRRLHSTILYASGTSPSIFAHRIERSAASSYDLVLTNDRAHAQEWIDIGAARAIALPLSAVDPSFHQTRLLSADDKRRFGCHIGFVGTLVPKRLYGRRVDDLAALQPYGLALWSVHEVPQILMSAYRGPALGDDMMRAVSGSTVVVNPHGDFMKDGGNQRLFEACGAGRLQITNHSPAVQRWFNVGEHLVTYRDQEELRALVTYFLENREARERIARAGQEHVYAHHTYDHRMQQLLDLLPGG